MPKSLLIQNFVLIDNLDIRFDKGFSVITGKTEMGKPITLGALSLVLGQRADGKSIKKGLDKCMVKAVFDVSKYQLEPLFSSNNLEYGVDSCILCRGLYASGKSRAFVNDSLVSLMILKELGSRLIDIRSQHWNLLLGDNRLQPKAIDIMAGNEILLTLYKKEFTRYQTLQRELKGLRDGAAQSKQEEDYIRFRLEQPDEANLQPDEQDELEQGQEALSHAEGIKDLLYRVTELLDGEEQGTIQIFKEALSTVDSLEGYFPKAEEVSERIRSVYVDLNDPVSEADVLKEDVEFNLERLEWVNERLNTPYMLQQKHRVPIVDELVAIRDQYQKQLRVIDPFDEQISLLEGQLDASYKELLRQASMFSEQCKVASTAMASQLVKMTIPLGVPNTRFRADTLPRKEPESGGVDDIRFVFSANKNAELQPVAQTVSGGEASRLMLYVKAMITGFTVLPTTIFDEVDTKVSGDIASEMGDIMQELGTKVRVSAIAHLPQIAAKGQIHYFVCKKDIENRTLTRIKQLEGEERVDEVARMLSGVLLAEASLANAKDLLGTKD